VRGRADAFVDEQNPPVDADIERPARRKRLIRIDDTVRPRDLPVRIAQNWVIDGQRFCEGLVRVRRIDADREVGGIEGPNVLATLTE
jgi:hypothetical protein